MEMSLLVYQELDTVILVEIPVSYYHFLSLKIPKTQIKEFSWKNCAVFFFFDTGKCTFF